MLLGVRLAPGNHDAQLAAVWVGLAVLMALRCLSVLVPLVRRVPPFDMLAAA
jgi:hypothetical protein